MDHKPDDLLFEKYMDGNLDFADEKQFEEHVKNCPACSARYSDLMRIRRGLSLIGDEPLPDGFTGVWKKSVYECSSTLPTRMRKRHNRLLPAIAAGVAVIAVVSAFMMSGVLFPSSSTQEIQMAASIENQESETFSEKGLQEEAAFDSRSANNESLPASDAENAAPYTDGGAATGTTAEAAEDTAAGLGGDKAAIALYVTPETFEALTDLLLGEGAEFCLDEGLLMVSVTEDNQKSLADFSEEYTLGVTPVPGEVYEVWVQE